MGNSKSKPKKGPEPSKPPLAPTPAPAAAAAPAKAVEEPKPAAAAPAKAAEEPVKPAETSPPPTEAKAPEPVAPAKRDSVKPAAEPAPAPAAEPAPASAPAAKRESIKAPAKRESVKGAVAASIDANDNDYIEENAEDSHKFPIVLDCGSFLSKAGLSDSTTAPSFVVPTVIGRAKSNTKVEGWLGQKDIYVGQEAEDKEEELFIKWPIDRGVVALSNWEDMEKIWHYLFYSKLRIKPSEHAVVITEAPLTPKASRERTVKLMFNTFKVPALYIGNSAVFSLYASGRTTGAVVELGDACSHVVGVTSGHVIPSSITEVSIAGRDITELMFKLLSDRGITFATHKSAHDVSRELKERFGYVAAEYDKEFEVAQDEDHEKTYDAPNGNSFTIGIERFKCGEALFQPSIVNPHLEQVGVHISVNDSIKGCSEDIQSQLYGNILLSGGTTMFAGFADRLKAELTKLAPSAVINIVRPPNRKYSAWVGAALFANEPLVKLLDKLVTKDEYAAEGYKVCEARFLSA